MWQKKVNVFFHIIKVVLKENLNVLVPYILGSAYMVFESFEAVLYHVVLLWALINL